MAGAAIASLALTSGCAARRVTLPSDQGVRLVGLDAANDAIVRACAPLRSFSAEVALSGRAGRERMRGRVLAGFRRPAQMRLEGVAPFGAPGFIMVASGGAATLLLPRDNAALTDTAPDAILEALTGLALSPEELLNALAGCVGWNQAPDSGATHANGWRTLRYPGEARLVLRPAGEQWRLAAVHLRDWTIEYPEWRGTYPDVVAVRGADVSLTARVTQIEANADIEDSAFTLTVPSSAEPISLEELRETGLMRGRSR